MNKKDRIVYKLFTIALLSLIISCSEFRPDEYHYLNENQHFSNLTKPFSVLTNNSSVDTLYHIRTIKATYMENFNGGSCKGNNGYWKFERIYFAFTQDTGSVRKSIHVAQNYDNGSCGSKISNPSKCIQFAYGFPLSKSSISNSPVMLLEESTYYCDSLIDTLIINSAQYLEVFRYKVDSNMLGKQGSIIELYFSKSEGIIRLKTRDKGDWIKIK
jgi:hypothetical protein